MRPLVFVVQWPFESSHPSLCPIDSIMHYRVTLCAVFCVLLAASLLGNSTRPPNSLLGRWQISLHHTVILSLYQLKEINVNMTIYGIHCFWAVPNTAFLLLLPWNKTAISSHAVVFQWVALTSIPFLIWHMLAIKSGTFRKSYMAQVSILCKTLNDIIGRGWCLGPDTMFYDPEYPPTLCVASTWQLWQPSNQLLGRGKRQTPEELTRSFGKWAVQKKKKQNSPVTRQRLWLPW